MINSKIILDKEYKKEIIFPILARNIDDNYVVLFTSRSCGTVVFIPEKVISYRIGYHDTGWPNLLESNHWEILSPDEKITLSNGQ
jgi:hypothetical protein